MYYCYPVLPTTINTHVFNIDSGPFDLDEIPSTRFNMANREQKIDVATYLYDIIAIVISKVCLIL